MSKINTTSAELVSVACDKIRSNYSTFRFCILRFSLKPLKKKHTHTRKKRFYILKSYDHHFKCEYFYSFPWYFVAPLCFKIFLSETIANPKKKIHAFSKQPNKWIYMWYISSCSWIFAYKWKKVPKNNEYHWWPKKPQ